jgi:tetratricopeptide (TPR) repeat protein
MLFNGTDTGSGEPIINGDLYQNGYTSDVRGFSFQSVNPQIQYPDIMPTKNTTIYWIQKAYWNPSKPKAIAALDTIIKTNPKDAWAWFTKGRVLDEAGRHDESLSAYNESLKLDPYFCPLWANKFVVFYELKKYDSALEAIEKAIQLEPNTGLFWWGKGTVLKSLGRTSESDAAFAKAKELGYTGGS